uniref:ABC transporter ATP-binding protein n=1 Tax=candidate division WOR-3 bacterium TaxID=2052148 RepID=A0A7V4E4J3_UNCW3
MPILEVNSLFKNYGKVQALKGISFFAEEGEIFGLIGPNGAGKTTTLRIISTLLTPSGGEVKVLGLDVQKDASKVRKFISYLPEEAGAYRNLRGIDYLKLMAQLYSDNKKEAEMMVSRAIEIANLGDRIYSKVSTYSKGMTRKLLLARALMHEPKLAILDEPTSGLDVLNAHEIRKIIKDFAKEGKTVLLSSHNMLEVEYLCDRVAFIHEGQIVEQGRPEELKKKYGVKNLEEVFVEAVK